MFESKKVRMNRLFHRGKCLDVAIDHGVCNEPSFLNGLEDMTGVVNLLVDADPDAIQVNYGQSDLLQNIPDVFFDTRTPRRPFGPVRGRGRGERAPPLPSALPSPPHPS